MRLLRAATLTVDDPEASADRYVRWLGYRVAERGVLAPEVAAAWGAPAAAGRPLVVVQPESGAPVFLRFVAGPTPDAYVPLRSHGWAAIELCVQDTLAVNARMLKSPFAVIGPPKELDGLPTIFPMQVRGPDREIAFLTQIRGDLPEYDLPRAASPVDFLFILVLGCADLAASAAWFERNLGLAAGRPVEIVYGVLNDAFDFAADRRHLLLTMTHERDVFLELDQYPPEALARPRVEGDLPPGIAVASFLHPDLDGLPGPWLDAPTPRGGAVSAGRRTGVLLAPDGVLVEVVEA